MASLGSGDGMALTTTLTRTFSTLTFVFIASILVNHCNAMYEDQVNVFDWRKQFIGNIKFAHFEQVSLSSRRLLVATESNVLASINARTGEIVWRKVFEKENGGIDGLLHQSHVLVTVSGCGRIVRSWDPSKGHLLWENTVSTNVIPTTQTSSGLSVSAYRKSLLAKSKTSSSAILLTLSGNALAAFGTSDGQLLWSKKAKYGSSYFTVHSDGNKVHLVTVKTAGQIELLTLDLESGDSRETKLGQVSESLLVDPSSCIVVSSSLVCLEEETKMIHAASFTEPGFNFVASHLALVLRKPNLGSGHWKLDAFNDPGDLDLLILSQSSGMKYVLNIEGTVLRVTKQFNSCNAVLLTGVGKRQLIAAVQSTPKELTTVKMYDANTFDEIADLGQSYNLSKTHGFPTSGLLYVFAKRDDELGYRVLLLMEDHSVLLLQQSGKTLWEREEALASINGAEMIDLPLTASEAKLELLHEEFSAIPKGGVLSMFVKRIQVQIKQLEVFIANLKKRRHFGAHSAEERPETEGLSRDQFSLHKMLVVSTGAGKLYGLDSANGNVVWSRFIPNLYPFERKGLLLFAQRTTAHFPLPPQCLVVGQNKKGDKTILFSFNPLTGESLLARPDVLPFSIVQGSLLPFTDEKFLKAVLLTDKNNQIHIYPETDKTRHELFDKLTSLYSYTINDNSGTIKGYSLSSAKEQEIGNIRCSEIWKVKIPADQEIINTVTHRHDEHVHSVGRVLGDRSVLYKYLNPNLVAVATVHHDKPKSSVYIYMIDAVTGHVVYQARHKNSDGPVRMILSEHWLTYIYSNTKARRSELAVVELYEGYEERNSTAFSSLDPWPQPLALSQAYVLPVGNVNAISVTNTERGITHKNILLALDSGHIYSLPKNLLDPRRKFDPTPADAEEGLVPYIPELPLVPVAYLNYNMTVDSIRSIHTAAAGLESTSLVLAYGLDVYFTRVTPSKMFDVLKEDFDYIFISGVLSALILATIVSSKLASIKTLKLAWM